MGQQLNKIVKRRRRKLYVARKKALAKSGLSRKSIVREPKAAKKTVKKASAPKKDKAPTKAAAAKVEAAPVAEVVAAAPVAEVAAPVAEVAAVEVAAPAEAEAPAAE